MVTNIVRVSAAEVDASKKRLEDIAEDNNLTVQQVTEGYPLSNVKGDTLHRVSDRSRPPKIKTTTEFKANPTRNLLNQRGLIAETLPPTPIKDFQTQYIVSYPSYMFGDFLSWLINQHNNFPKWQLCKILPYSPSSERITWPFMQMQPKWFYFLDELSSVYIDGTQEAFDNLSNWDEMNQNVKKFSSKIHNDVHQSAWERNHPFQIPDVLGHTISVEGAEMIRAVMPNTKIIQMHIEDITGITYKTYRQRCQIPPKPHNRQPTSSQADKILAILDQLEYNNQLAPTEQDHIVYIDKIFNNDDSEYEKLCNFIDEDPIDDWKERTNIYLERILLT